MLVGLIAHAGRVMMLIVNTFGRVRTRKGFSAGGFSEYPARRISARHPPEFPRLRIWFQSLLEWRWLQTYETPLSVSSVRPGLGARPREALYPRSLAKMYSEYLLLSSSETASAEQHSAGIHQRISRVHTNNAR